MITVYFESTAHAEVVARFDSEELYNACLPTLEAEAKKFGMMVTESVTEDVLLVEVVDEIVIRNNVDSTINFMYFANNFPHDWMDRVWGKDNHIYNHLADKWFSLNRSNSVGGTLNFFKMFMELDNKNKTILLTWIEENYKG